MSEKKERKPTESPAQRFAKALKGKFGDKIRVASYSSRFEIHYAPDDDTVFHVTNLHVRTVDDNPDAAVDIVVAAIADHPKGEPPPEPPKPAPKPKAKKQEPKQESDHGVSK